MVAVAELLRLGGYAVGALGGLLVFVEFFQTPNYVEFNEEFEDYSLNLSPSEVRQYTMAGRAGGFCLALAFALLFLATLVG
jgi:hypothetical protein